MFWGVLVLVVGILIAVIATCSRRGIRQRERSTNNEEEKDSHGERARRICAQALPHRRPPWD